MVVDLAASEVRSPVTVATEVQYPVLEVALLVMEEAVGGAEDKASLNSSDRQRAAGG